MKGHLIRSEDHSCALRPIGDQIAEQARRGHEPTNFQLEQTMRIVVGVILSGGPFGSVGDVLRIDIDIARPFQDFRRDARFRR